MRVAKAITLTDEERGTLTKWSRGRSTPARLVLRAKIVLAAAAGKENKEIAAELGARVGPSARGETALPRRLAGIEKDAPRGGRAADDCGRRSKPEIIRKTTQETPPAATHWSTRIAGRGGSEAVAWCNASGETMACSRIGRRRSRSRTIRSSPRNWSTSSGLYLNPPEHALVLCVRREEPDSSPRSHAEEPADLSWPAGTMTHDYKRQRHDDAVRRARTWRKAGDRRVHAAASASGVDQVSQADRRRDPPELDLHLIVDNYATHKHPKVQRWLTRHPRFHMHFTPTSSSWLNMVERWFREITHNGFASGVFRSVAELIQAIRDYIDHHNANPKAFVWTKKAADILEKVRRARRPWIMSHLLEALH